MLFCFSIGKGNTSNIICQGNNFYIHINQNYTHPRPQRQHRLGRPFAGIAQKINAQRNKFAVFTYNDYILVYPKSR